LAWIALPLLLIAGLFAYVVASFRWLRKQTTRDRYFSRPLPERRALKAEIARRARLFVPVMTALARVPWIPDFDRKYRGVAFSPMVCPRAVFEAATRYQPDSRDIFVATQMKCGTTWMQQVVFEILCRGRGDLSDTGLRHMYAASPWIESVASVSMEDAPRIGESQARIIKTHLPALLCPYSEKARYIYVTRHPVACFASCIDFTRFVAGPLMRPEGWLDKFCSDDMWWQPWPDHVAGWWDWSVSRSNVLFVHYEDMLADLGTQVDAVAAFLGVELLADERAAVVRKCGFAYMKEHEEVFEMTPPSYFSMRGGSYFASGKAERVHDVGPEATARIGAFCRERLAGAAYPLERFYPDVAKS